MFSSAFVFRDVLQHLPLSAPFLTSRGPKEFELQLRTAGKFQQACPNTEGASQLILLAPSFWNPLLYARGSWIAGMAVHLATFYSRMSSRLARNESSGAAKLHSSSKRAAPKHTAGLLWRWRWLCRACSDEEAEAFATRLQGICLRHGSQATNIYQPILNFDFLPSSFVFLSCSSLFPFSFFVPRSFFPFLDHQDVRN